MPVLELIISLSIFSHVGSEIQLGVSLSFIGVFSLILMYLFGKFADYKHYNLSVILVNVLFVIGIMLFLFSVDLHILLLGSSLITASFGMYALLFGVIANNSLHSIKNYKEHNTNFNISKEFGYFVGWISGYLIIFFSGDLGQESLKVLFYCFIILSMFCSAFLIKIGMHNIKG